MNTTRKGFTILETIAALALLAAGSVFTVEVLATCASHRSASRQLVAAQLEAANVAERVALVPYEKLTESAVQEWKVSPTLLEQLPQAKLSIAISPSSADELAQKRVAIKIEWPAADETSTGVNLTTWRFAPREEMP
jgi:prepilin-type N-terminal cleavage/methylation domain-containing protein